jgi:hypothetical protein
MVATEQPSRNRLSGQVILVLLLVTFPLLALLVLQQGRVIDAQRLLILQLSGDSQQLNSIRIRELQNRGKQAAPPAMNSRSDTQPQSGQQPGADPQQKNHKRREKKPAPPAAPQEYPGTRQAPIRKLV